MNSVGGPDLLLYLVLAFGGAMFVGNLLALVRPPTKPGPKKRTPAKGSGVAKGSGSVANERTGREPPPGTPPKLAPLPAAPKARTIAMMAVGGIASVWAIATLLTK